MKEILSSLFPSKVQWKKWSLPSKLGVASAYLTIGYFGLDAVSSLYQFAGKISSVSSVSDSAPALTDYDPNVTQIKFIGSDILIETEEERYVVSGIEISSDDSKDSTIALKQGLYDFKVRHSYNDAIPQFQKALVLSSNESNKKRIKELITASYYGAGRHSEGIHFVCEKYSSLSHQSDRYKYDFHAHLRRVAIVQSYKEAEKIVNEKKPFCKKDDLSPIWAALPLKSIEDIQAGFVPDFSLKNIDVVNLERLIYENPKDPYVHYAYLALGKLDKLNVNTRYVGIGDLITLKIIDSYTDFSQVLKAALKMRELWPNSYYLDELDGLVLEKLSKSKIMNDYYALTEKVSHLPPSSVQRAFESIVGNYFLDGRMNELLNDIHSDYEISKARLYIESVVLNSLRHTEKYKLFDLLAFSKAMNLEGSISNKVWSINFDRGIENVLVGDYAGAIYIYRSQLNMFKRFSIPPVELINKRIDVIDKALELKNKELLLESSLKFGKESAKDYFGFHSNRVYIEALSRCKESSKTSIERQKCHFLLALNYRRSEQNSKSLIEFESFATNYPESELIDDAIAEIGVHYLLINYDLDTAERYFRTVYTNYPDRNAADNSLNWLAWAYFKRGDLSKSSYYYGLTASSYAQNRLGKRAVRMLDFIKQKEKTIVEKSKPSGELTLTIFDKIFKVGWVLLGLIAISPTILIYIYGWRVLKDMKHPKSMLLKRISHFLLFFLSIPVTVILMFIFTAGQRAIYAKKELADFMFDQLSTGYMLGFIVLLLLFFITILRAIVKLFYIRIRSIRN